MNRKPYNIKAGYIASRHNQINNGWVVIYLAKEQGLDDSQGKYAVSCELHNVLTFTSSLPKARPLLKVPDFCEECVKPECSLSPLCHCDNCKEQGQGDWADRIRTTKG